MSSTGATERIVDYALELSRADIDQTSRLLAKWLVLDLLGVAYVGATGGDSDVAVVAATVERADGRSTVIGCGSVAAPHDAALVNAYAAHLMEFDDATLRPVGHASTVVLPALLAVAEDVGSTGAEVLDAYLVGLEVHARLGEAQHGNWSAEAYWLPIGTISQVAASVAVSRLRGLDARATTYALGMAAHLSGHLAVSNGSAAKPLGAGQAAWTAVMAVELASRGLDGPERIIERPGGFGQVFLGTDEESLETALARLGGPMHLTEVGVAVKQYPSCYGTHWSVDALRELMAEHGLTADSVEAVELRYPDDAAFLDDPEPGNVEQARFSLQYGLAATLEGGYPQVGHFTEEMLHSAVVRGRMQRVGATVHPPELPTPQRWRHVVQVRTTDGRSLEHSVARPKGHPRRPLDDEELSAKFLDNVSALPPAVAGGLLDDILRMDGDRPVGFFETLRRRPSPRRVPS